MNPIRVFKLPVFTGFLMVLSLVLIAGCSNAGKELAALQAKVDSLQIELNSLTGERAMVETHLVRFDSLDFDIFSNQEWDLLNVSHSDDIVVNWPDGHHTNGIATHIEDLKAMFVYAPDTKIETHPIRFGSGEWTCVTGTMSGTFSKPMPIGGGKTIQPTGKKFNVSMCTVAHWKEGKMIEESLYWDNQTFMKQIGLAK